MPFQFHNGAIKRIGQFFLNKRLAEFQFHNGAIKRACGATRKVPGERFNSTLVRLKVGNLNSTISACSRFNSTLVRLKVPSASFKFSRSWSFNSTLVRLKDENVTAVPDTEKFQFHTGSIKRRGKLRNNTRDSAVSIPHWFD